MNTIRVDFSKPYGKVKPFNAINNGPGGHRGGNNRESWKAARIPYARLHDTSFANEWLVDVHRIFRDFDADENDPKNYVFAPTDSYIAALFAVGTEPYYRLGASIEHSQKFGTIPPKDNLKWARICEHIIRHYTEGWADGFNYDIKYWEIWNEADNDNPTGNPCWQGTREEFYDFFCTVCPYLQEKFPNLKIGGPAIATFWHTEWCDKLFATMQERGVKPDFISYHRYNKTIEDFVEYVRLANSVMEKYGFAGVETHINEWNYIRGWRGEDFMHTVKAIKGVKGAAFTTGVMCALHPEKLDMLMYYDGRRCEFCGLWDTDFFNTLKGYYPFLAWSELVDLGTAVETKNDEYLYSVGAMNDKDAAILCTYFNQDDGIPEKQVRLEVRGLKIAEGESYKVQVCPIDEEHDMECVREEVVTSGDFNLFLDFPPYATYYIKITKE